MLSTGGMVESTTKNIFKQSFKGDVDSKEGDNWGKSILGQENKELTNLEPEVCQVCSRIQGVASTIGFGKMECNPLVQGL